MTTPNPTEQAKSYMISHISDILDIPEDKFDDFMIDLKKSYKITKDIRELTLILGDETDNKSFLPCIEWIDDDKHDTDVEVSMNYQRKDKEK